MDILTRPTRTHSWYRLGTHESYILVWIDDHMRDGKIESLYKAHSQKITGEFLQLIPSLHFSISLKSDMKDKALRKTRLLKRLWKKSVFV